MKISFDRCISCKRKDFGRELICEHNLLQGVTRSQVDINEMQFLVKFHGKPVLVQKPFFLNWLWAVLHFGKNRKTENIRSGKKK